MQRIRSVAHTAFTVLICASLVAFSALQLRYGAAVFGFLTLPQATAYAQSGDLTISQSGEATTVIAEYCSEAVVANDSSNASGKTSTELSFDDSWFREDSRAYNHELATACSVLSAVCNSESQFYGRVDGAVPYAEQTLSSLGFSNVHTESYALRSDLLDQVAAFFVSSHDVAAYAFASKTIAGKGSSPDETLVFVGIRGSYGIEWLSNLKLYDDGTESGDHRGAKLAEKEIEQALGEYLQEIGAQSGKTKILITGHSRGGAIANLLAAELDDQGGSVQVAISSEDIYAYTFASPGTTRADDCLSQKYGNIFNIVNPADVFTRLPLSDWGFGRYGSTIALPSVQDDNFENAYSAMQGEYFGNTGCIGPCEVDSLGQLSSFGASSAKKIPTVEHLLSFDGVLAAFEGVSKIDAEAALATHYPDTYIAWMQSVNPKKIVAL